MVRAFVLYEGEAPDADRYEQHNRDFSSKVPGATIRHGGVFGAAFGESKYKYYFEFEWPDMDSFKAATRSDSTVPRMNEAGVPAVTIARGETCLRRSLREVMRLNILRQSYLVTS